MSVHKKLFIVGVAAALSSFVPIASANEGSLNVSGSVKVSDITVSASSTGRSESETENAKSDESVGGNIELNNQNDEDATSTGDTSREMERSAVAVRVQTLLSLANRDGGIGEEVRVAAHEIASSTDRIDNEKAEVEGRPAWVVFIIGSDFKNLGAIRSDISTSESAIQRLIKARDRSTDASVRADLTAQINALTISASTTEAFVISHEGAFSLLGWFFRIFSR